MYDKKKNLDRIHNALSDKMREIRAEGREKPDADERAWADKLMDAEKRIEAGEEFDLDASVSEPIRPDVSASGNRSSKNMEIRKTGTPHTLKGPNDDKSYRSLFGDGLNYRWKDTQAGFFDAALSGRYHPELVTRTLVEGIGSDGGFWVPSETATKIHEVSLEEEIVMPRALVQPMKTNEYTIPGYAIGNHSNNLAGGFVAFYKSETGTLTEANPKAREIHLKTKKLTGLIRMSRELLDDKVEGERGLIRVMGKGLGWYRDKFFLKGSGAGEPLGILNSPCLLVQAKDSGQSSGTISYSNIGGVMGKLAPASFNRSTWICHVSTVESLLKLGLPVGTGGSHYRVLSEKDGKFRMLGRPVVFTEKTETLGNQGDVILADLSQYIIGLTVGMRFAVDESRYFESDEVVAKVIERHDGMPLWNEALTLEDGSTEVSPFVTLAARA